MDEDFAVGRVVQFGHDATTLGQGAQVGSGVQCPLEYLHRCLTRVLRNVRDNFVQRGVR